MLSQNLIAHTYLEQITILPTTSTLALPYLQWFIYLI